MQWLMAICGTAVITPVNAGIGVRQPRGWFGVTRRNSFGTLIEGQGRGGTAGIATIPPQKAKTRRSRDPDITRHRRDLEPEPGQKRTRKVQEQQLWKAQQIQCSADGERPWEGRSIQYARLELQVLSAHSPKASAGRAPASKIETCSAP